MTGHQKHTFLIFGLVFLSTFVWSLPENANWNVKVIGEYDVLYYWEAQSNYTYAEAKEVCLRRNMPSRVNLDDILADMNNNTDYWAPHVVEPAYVVHVSGYNTRIIDRYENLAEKKGVICTATLKGAMVMFRNGLSHYFGRDKSPIPSYCHPQNANRNEHDLAACMLVIQKYEL